MKGSGIFKEMAKYYDFIYSFKGKDYAGEAAFLDRMINKYGNKGKQLLDAGCGTGEHLVYLKRKYDVMGLDLHREMINVARKKLGNVELRQGDMRSFNLNKKYDVIICMFSSINYNRTRQDYLRTFRNFYRHLNKGGVVVGDLFTRDMFDPKGVFGYDLYEKGDLHVGRLYSTKLEGNTGMFYFMYLVKDGKKVLTNTGVDRLGIFPLSDLKLMAMKQGLMPVVFETSNKLFERSFMVLRKD